MRTKIQNLIVALAIFAGVHPARAQGTTAFTYQGRLNDGAGPASGNYDLRFAIYDAGASGNQIGNLLTNAPTPVSNGLFTVTLDFGSLFSGTNYWLEIGVRTNGNVAAYTTLLPRQQLTPAPYAIYSSSAGAVNGLVIQNNATSPNVILGYSGNTVGPGVVSGGATISGGGYNGESNYVSSGFGTIGGGYLNSAGNEATVGGGSANSATGFRAVIAGGRNNFATAQGATVGGGYLNAAQANNTTVAGGFGNIINISADDSSIGGGIGNMVGGFAVVVAGGQNNLAGGSNAVVTGGQANSANANFGFIGGGQSNNVVSDFCAVGGGAANTAGYPVFPSLPYAYATVSGGFGNKAGNGYATIGGGDRNIVGGQYGTVGGGTQNNAYTFATVAGGYQNQAGGYWSTVAGGKANIASSFGSFVGGGGTDGTADGQNFANGAASAVVGGMGNLAGGNYSAIPGGSNNVAAGQFSFAAGQQAQANHQGAFVWADSQNAAFASSANDQFLIRAQGGVGIGTNNPQSALHVNGSVTANSFIGSGIGLTQLPVSVVTNNATDVTLTGNIKAANGLVIENRTSDPPSPAVGQIWLRTDL